MFQERIREYYESLTPGFRRLADFIVNHTLDAAFLTASELARRVDVDPATVVRFSQEIGYSGYRELSREIKKYVRDQVTATYRAAEEATTEEDILNVILDNTLQQLGHFRTTDTQSLAEAVEILIKAKCIWVTGEYTSYDLAQYFSKSLDTTLGIPSKVFHPSISETAAAINCMEDGDVLLALVMGIPGLDTGYAIKLANNKGYRTVCLTTSGTTLPAREADHSVIVPTKSAVGIASFNIPLLVLGVMWEAINASDVERSARAFTAVHDNMGTVLGMRQRSKSYEVPKADV